MFVFFHLRRLDGRLEPDTIGLELPVDRLAAEALAGAKGLICEAINTGQPIIYLQFEIESWLGVSLLTFPFEGIVRYAIHADDIDNRDAIRVCPVLCDTQRAPQLVDVRN